MRHIQTERQFTNGRLIEVVGHGGLGVKAQPQHRRQAGQRRRHDHAARNGAGHKAQACRVLLHITGAPGGLARAQHKAQLGVMVASKLVQLAGAGHFFAHFRKLGRAVDGVAKGLGFHHKLGVLNVIERPGAVGQLHAGLEQHVALAGQRHLPVLGGLVETFNGKGLAARAPRRRHGQQSRIARHHTVQRDGRNNVNQRIHGGLFLGHWQGKAGHIQGGSVQAGLGAHALLGLRVRATGLI